MKYIERAAAAATEYLRNNGMTRASVALMISVYKNENLPLNLRIQCAMAAAPFERPRLVATASVHKTVTGGSDANFGRIFAQIEERLPLQPPEARAALIEVLRDDE